MKYWSWNIERSIMMERYEKTGHSIVYQITHNNIILHKNQSLKIWTEFRLNFADRWIILWWRRWKLAPSISISHNHYPVFPWYFIGISPCISPCIFPCISPCIVLVWLSWFGPLAHENWNCWQTFNMNNKSITIITLVHKNWKCFITFHK